VPGERGHPSRFGVPLGAERADLRVRNGAPLKEARLDNERAKKALETERRRVEGLLGDTVVAGEEDRDEANAQGDMADPAQRLTAEGLDDAVAAGLRDRLEAIERAEARLRAGTYGLSVKSGLPIPNARLEADPAAELTVEEASEEPPAV
jgi:DnaK suppressor protein